VTEQVASVDEARVDAPATGRRLAVLEWLFLLAAPAIGWAVLRLALMARIDMPDPAIHTMFIVAPHQLFRRLASVFGPIGDLHEGARAGFLVPARIGYLLFGAVPGFVVTRYVFALVAIVPAYLLLRRLYGRAAGWLAVAVILTSPVVVVAWGTDYPDSAVVSYLIAGLACLALSWTSRHRLWLGLAVGFLTLAVWAHGMAAPLVAVTAVAYLAIRAVRRRDGLAVDSLLALGVFAIVTGLLSLASGLLIGPYNIVTPTLQTITSTSQLQQVARFHSSNWHWAPYVSYLLLPPAVLAAAVVVFARRLRAIDSPQLTVVLVGAAQLGLFAGLQFASHFWTLEYHYFSSMLWGGTCLAMALVLAELGRPLLQSAPLRWVPAVAVLGVALGYEADRRVPAFGWVPWGASTAGLLLGAALVGRLSRQRRRPGAVRLLGAAGSCIAVAGAALILVVAPIPRHPHLPGTGRQDPPPAYDEALGGADSGRIDWYRVTADVPAFVGDGTFPNEQLMTWWPHQQQAQLLEPLSLYRPHQSLPTSLGQDEPVDAAVLSDRRPAEVLFLSTTGAGFRSAFDSLRQFAPRLVRTDVLRSGSAQLHLWLVQLMVFSPGVTG
jgi:hypothetical protein